MECEPLVPLFLSPGIYRWDQMKIEDPFGGERPVQPVDNSDGFVRVYRKKEDFDRDFPDDQPLTIYVHESDLGKWKS